MKKVLLFPGAFNPPHLGHISMIEMALRSTSFDEVWIMPSGKRTDKEISIDYEDRRNLGKLFVEHVQSKVQTPVKLITAELDDTEDKITEEILKEMKSQPDIEITQLIGLDGYLGIRDSLTDPNEKFLIVQRTGYKLPVGVTIPDGIRILNEDAQDISSTQIRNMIETGNDDFRHLVPEKIADYIKDRSLYTKA